MVVGKILYKVSKCNNHIGLRDHTGLYFVSIIIVIIQKHMMVIISYNFHFRMERLFGWKISVAYPRMMWYAFNNSMFLFSDRILTKQRMLYGADDINVANIFQSDFLHQFLDLMLL